MKKRLINCNKISSLKTKMKISLFLFLLINLTFAKSLSQDKITLNIESGTIFQVIDEIESNTDYKFIYITNVNDFEKRISISVIDQSIKLVLDMIFDNKLEYEVLDKKIILKKAIKSTPVKNNEINTDKDQDELQKTISGSITDKDGNPLPGASIIEKGTTNGAVTSFDGDFSLNVTNANATLVVSFIGFLSQEISVAGQDKITIALIEDTANLDEVVIVGYGTVRKSDLTGSVGQMKAEEINSYPATNILQSMTGRIAGVQVIQSTGAPGAEVSVRIRGTNSIQGGNEPLYVIDGFPYSGNPTIINNFDIKSLEVLKDASATAIYGSRGANGVVLITTKRGESGVTKIDLETSYSSQTLRNKLELMNGEEYAAVANIQAANDGVPTYFTQQEVNAFGEGTDWQDIVFQEAPIKSTSLNIRGGSEMTQFSIGGSVFDQEGIIKGSGFQRYSLNTNFDHKISKKFSIRLSNTLTYTNTNRRDNGGGARASSLIGAALAAAPISEPYNADGTYTVLGNAYPFVPVDVRNPLNFINEQDNEDKSNALLTNLSFIYNIAPELSIKLAGGIENRDNRTDNYTTRNFHNSDGIAYVGTNQYRSLLSENTINYNKTFAEKHSISAVAGFTYQDFVSTSLAASGMGFLSDVFETHNLGASANPGIPSTGYVKSVLLSYLGRANYSYDDKYLMTISFRADGSSRYSEGNKWGYFPSAALAWKIGNEDFMQEMDVISDLKLRASYGKTGSQAIDPYTTLNLLNSGQTVMNDGLVNTFSPGTRLPGDLKWETTDQYDVGFDLALLNNRILVTADYYVKNTKDLLNTVVLASSSGFTRTIQNVGSIQNKGFEFDLSAKVLTGEFNWDLSANISFNRNEVTGLYKGEDLFTSSVSVLAINDNVQILREGSPVGQFWGFVEDGYDDQGHIKIVDQNGDGSINSEDKTFIGDANPDFIYGINSSMSYKNFDLNIFIQGSQGNDIFNVSVINPTNDFGQGLNAPRDLFSNHWTPQNTNAKYPLISRATNAYASDRWIEDGSYMRLKNIELAYNLPIENSALSSAQFYLSGQNLITITDYSWWDPEVNSRGAGQAGIDHNTYPIPKTVTVGVRVGF